MNTLKLNPMATRIVARMQTTELLRLVSDPHRSQNLRDAARYELDNRKNEGSGLLI